MTPRSIADDIRADLGALSVDTATRAALEAWLDADKEFNVWFLVTTKRSLGDDDLLGLLDGYRESQESAESAWRSFRAEKIDAAGLRAGLDTSLAKMREMMNRP